jgi:hypothetical protein
MTFDDIISLKVDLHLCMKPDIEELHRKYIENYPEGLISKDIRRMIEDKTLDMNYFLNDN